MTQLTTPLASPRRTLTNLLHTWLPWAVTTAAFVVLSVRVQRFVHTYAVDVMCWDSWQIYQPLFRGQGWWATFDQQHGPHRQGVGGLVVRATAALTHWDTRADAAAVGWTLTLTVPLAVWLAWRCGVRGLPLAGVPVVVLNIRQWQQLEVAANPAHGAVPLLLLTLYGLAWFARRSGVRLTLLTVLTGCLIFTGFGLFVGLITPPLLVAEMVRAARSGERRRAVGCAVAVAAVVAVWAAFAHGWRADAGSDHFVFPVEHPSDYVRFVGGMLSNAVGLAFPPADPGPAAICGGLVIAAAGVVVCVVRGRRAWRAGLVGDPAAVAVFTLAAYGLLFTAYAAVGRTPEGWASSAAPRYVTHATPLLLAVLIHLATVPGAWGRWAAVVVSAGIAVGTFSLRSGDLLYANHFHNGLVRWRAAYLATGDVEAANARTRFPINDKPVAPWEMDYLRAHGLNMFDPTVYHAPPRAAGTPPVSR